MARRSAVARRFNRPSSRRKSAASRTLSHQTLERRELLAADLADPNPSADVAEVMGPENPWAGGNAPLAQPLLVEAPDNPDDFLRWSTSAITRTAGEPETQLGDNITVTWSIVPDGTRIASENTQSNLVAFFDGIYGGSSTNVISEKPWFQIFETVYDVWSENTGISFQYEPNDDGVDEFGQPDREMAGEPNSLGELGLRGDMRIGGAPIDGDGNILAYNFFPNNNGEFGADGDMVIDTSDIFYSVTANNPGGLNANLINILAHEVGHGLGLSHVLPLNNTVLMEPIIVSGIYGPQEDDVFNVHILYGDELEPSDNRAEAIDLGVVDQSGPITRGVSIDNANTDVDYYRFELTADGEIDVAVRPQGTSYLVGPEGQSGEIDPFNPPELVDRLSQHDLQLTLRDESGAEIQTVNATGAGDGEFILGASLSAGVYFVEVGSVSGTEAQMYEVAIGASDQVLVGPQLLAIRPDKGSLLAEGDVLQTAPSEFNLYFNGGANLDETTVNADTVKLIRAGEDGVFGPNPLLGDANDDIEVALGYVGLVRPGDTDDPNLQQIVMRPASSASHNATDPTFAFPDDTYRIEIVGEGINPLQSRLAEPFGDANDFQVDFRLDRGAQVIAVVPQPVSSNPGGSVTQARNQIVIYFDDQVLDRNDAENEALYQLFQTNATADESDDVLVPSTDYVATYDSAANTVTLTFTDNLAEGNYRLDIGQEYTPPGPVLVGNGLMDNNDNVTDESATLLGTITADGIRVVSSLQPQSVPLPPRVGGNDEPGHRTIQREQHIPSVGTDLATPDAVEVISYYFPDTLGTDANGTNFPNLITDKEKEIVRQIIDIYASLSGYVFVEIDLDMPDDPPVPQRFMVGKGDFRAVSESLGPDDGVAGLANSAFSILNATLFNQADRSFGDSFTETMAHEIGHSIGLDHSYELPSLMGAGLPNDVLPGDHDVVHLQRISPPNSTDIDLYQIVVPEAGRLTAETIAERLPTPSNLDTVLTMFRVDSGQLTPIARNDRYFGSDSFLDLQLDAGTYVLGVTSTGNSTYDPLVPDSGFGGITDGNYELQVDFERASLATIRDIDGTSLDGDRDGTPGGKATFYFQASDPVSDTTIFVNRDNDDDVGTVDGDGSLADPLDTLSAALDAAGNRLIVPAANWTALGAADSFDITITQAGTPTTTTFKLDGGFTSTSIDTGTVDPESLAVEIARVVNDFYDPDGAGPATGPMPATASGRAVNFSNIDSVDVSGSAILSSTPNLVRIVGSTGPDGDVTTTNDNRSYLVGTAVDGSPLRDGTSFNVPQGVTVMIEAGTLIKLHRSNLDAGSSSIDINRGGGAMQFLGTPETPVWLRSYFDTTIGSEPPIVGTAEGPGDYGGIVFRADSDLEEQGMFLNYVSHTDIRHGGGKVLIETGEETFSPIQMIDARPTVAFNTIRDSADAAVSANPDSFAESLGRIGPDVVGNFLRNNSFNGLFISIETDPSRPTTKLTVPGRFNDTDIPHILTESLLIDGQPGGQLLDEFGNLISVRSAGRLTIDAGIVLKIDGARIESELGGSALIAEGTPDSPIIFTSLQDDRYGGSGVFDTTGTVNSVGTPGDWGGLYFGQTSQGSIDNAIISFAGGDAAFDGDSDNFNAVEIHQADVRIANTLLTENADGNASGMRGGRGANDASTIYVRGSQPILLNNQLVNNAGSGISINANSLKLGSVPDRGRSTGLLDAYTQFDDNVGPLIRLNAFENNGLNGMLVRSEVLTTEGIWDDTDIVHVVGGEIIVDNYHTNGGLTLKSSGSESLVVKFAGANAGITATGTPLDIVDRVGGAVTVLGAPGFPVVLTSLFDDTVGAGFTPSGLGNTDTGNDGFSDGLPGDWRGLVFDEWSNDRNVAYVLERESPLTSGKDVNFAPSNAQFLGELATDLKNGDENRRLGFEVNGFISPDDASDVDVYAFEATAGTPIWIDLDRTGSNLDGVIELINSSGTVLARSIRSTDPAFADSVNAQTLTQNPLLGGDYFTENFRDAGMHLVLPGTPGAESRYFIRVRSLPTGEISSLDGNSRGAYQLQVRLRQVDEVPGSLVQYADIRFADKGLDIRGLPSRSLLTGNVGESAANNDTLANSQTLVNLLETDTAALSIAGNLANRNDVDWYSFDVSHVGVQSIPGVNDSNGTVAVVFDMDYADKFNRADTTIAVYDASGQLVFVGRESNIDEDRPEGTDPQIDDLNRGSSGSKDPYIGPIHLLGGQVYSVAVMSNAVTPTPLVQFYSADLAGDDNRLVRLEPINSVQRVVEDHIGNTGYSAGPDGVENKFEATTQSIFNIADADALRNDHLVGSTLNDVPLFVSTDRGGGVNADDQLYLANAFVGGQYTRPVSPDNWQEANNDIQDITIRSDGRMFGYLSLTANGNDDTVGQLVEIDPSDGTILSTQNDNIPGSDPTPNERDIDPGSPNANRGTADSRADEFTNADDVDALAIERTGNASQDPTYDVYYSVRESDNSSKLYRARENGDATPEAANAGGPNGGASVKYGLVGNINVAGTSYAETTISVRNNGTPVGRTDIRIKSTQPGTPGDFTMTLVRQGGNTNANIVNVNVAARTFTLNIGNNNGGGPSAQAIVNAINNNANVSQLVTAVVIGGNANNNGEGNNGTVANNVVWADDVDDDGTHLVMGAGTPLAGRVTGLSFDDPVTPVNLYGVTAGGEFLAIDSGDGSATLLSVTPNVSFSALTQGPQNADGGVYRDLFFATGVFDNGTPGGNDDEIRLYAFNEFGVAQTTYLDIDGNPQDIFDSGSDHVVLTDIPSADGDVPTGIAFSPLDVNLWHPTTQRATDAGHGIYAAPDGSRTPNEYDIDIPDDRSNGREFTERDGAASFYFGLEDWIEPNQFDNNTEGYLTYDGEENAQFGLTEEIHRDLVSNPDLINTYAIAGGVAGSLVSNPFSLAGSVPEDRPTLYVNYFLETENHPGETDVNGADPFRDSARILASVDGGVSWSTLATNNSALSARNPTANGQAELPGFISHLSDAGLNSGTPRDESHQIVQELFDNTGSWRQVRVDLSSFANQSDVRLRFDFSTSGRIFGDGVDTAFGELTSENRSTSTLDNGFEGFYIDDIIVGYAERGEMVTVPGNRQPTAPDASTFVLMSESPTADNTRTSNRDPNQNPEILSGDYQLEVRRVDEYAILADDEILLEGLSTPFGQILAPGLEAPFPGVSFPFDTNDRLTLETATGGVGFDADRNRERQQGVFIVDSNFITESATVGIHVQPGAVDAEGVAHPGATIHFPQLNADQLVPGVVIENNVIVGASGIQFDGDVQAEPNRPVPYGRIINNTLSGRGNGTGIDVTGRAAPTIINNIVHNFGLGIDTDGQSNDLTVLRSNYFQLNGTNGPTGTDAILAATTDPLFVGVNNYYLADGSAAIDSSSNTLADRLNFVTFRTELGISQSNIVAPDRDVFGQLRVDSDGAGSGGGSDVFRDRGAVDEADTDSPYVILLDPLDNDIAGVDADPNETVVLLNDPVSEAFLLLIGDGRGPNAPFEGTGIDASTVSEQTIRVRRNNVELTEGVDYIRGFNESTGELRLTPLTTLWQPGSVYEISLDNTVIADRAGNQLRPNRPDGSTAFTIILPTVLIDFGDAVRAGATTYSTLLADDGARHALINGGEVRLGGIVDEESDSRLAVGGEDDDRVAVTVNHISAGTFAVSAVDDVTSIEVIATPTVGDLLLVNVGEGTVTFEFIATGTAASPGNRGFVFDPAESIDTIAARLTDVLMSTFADFGGGLVLTLVPGAGVASPVITLTNLDDEDGLDIGVYNDGTVDRYVTLSTGNQADTTDVDDVLGYLNPLDDRGANYVLHSNSVGFVDAWIDFNGNGIFEPDSETILDSVAVTPGANTFNVITPAGATDKVTWARFRISPEGGATPSGLVVGGEVEDYQISIINVAPVVPADDEYEIDEDGELDSASLVANPSVLDNDAKDLAQFTTLETIVVDEPLFGDLELYANGEFLYSPDNDFAGIDTFTYRVVDQDTGEAGPMFDDQGNPINIGTVTINVQPVNDLPSTSDVTLTAIEDTQRIIDKDELIGLSLADGIPSFTWIDPNDTSVPPVVQTAPWDESLQVLEIISLETAADGLITSASGVGPFTTPRGQFLAFWDGVNLDRIEYTPDQDLNQDHGKANATDPDIFDSFQFTVQDDGRLVNPGADFTIPDDDTERFGTVLAATATALIDVKPIDDIAVGADDLISENNAQWIAFPGSTTPTEDTTLTIPQAYLLDNDVVARATAEDETGGINDAGVRVADVSPTSAEGGTVSIVGTDVIYSPADNQYGIDTFTYTLVDTGISFNPATGSDEADDTDSVTVTVSILVKPINDAPQADPLTLELVEYRESVDHEPNSTAKTDGIGLREFDAQTLLRLNESGSALEVSPPNEFPLEFNESEQELRVVQIGSSVGGLSIDARTLTYDPATGQAAEQTLETPDGELRLQFALDPDPANPGAFLPGTGHLVTGVYEPDTDYNETAAGNPTDEFTFVVQDFGEITVPGADSFLGESTTTDNHGLLTSEPATVTLITRQTNDEPVLPNPPLVTFEEDHAGGVALFYDIYNSTFVDSDDPAVHGLSPVILVGPETADDEELREQVTVTLSDVTTSAPAGMFAVDPVLDQYGVLSFTAAPNAFGYAVFTITATDDGLSYSENANTVEPDPLSVTRQLTIHITPVNDRPVTGDRQLTVDEVEEFTDGTGDPTPDQAVLLLNPDQFLNGQVAGEEAEQSDFTDDMALVDQFDEEDQMLRVVQFTVEDMDGNSVVVDAENNNGTPIDLATGTIVFNFDDIANGGAFTGGDFRPYVDRNDRTPFDPTDEQFTYVVEDFGLADIPGFSRTDPDSASEEDYTSAIPDENRSLPGNVTITIRQVNDAPVFPELGTISFPEDVNPDGDPVFIDVYTNTQLPTNDRAVHNLPQDIFVADPNTALDELERQTLVFSYSPLATSAPEGMFTADPILDEYGVLTLMPAPDAFGYAVFEITATDNGVDASGADDPRSITRTLTVHITPVNDRPVTEDRQLTVEEVEEFANDTGAPTGDEAVLLLNPDQFLIGQVAGTEAEPSDIPTDDPAVAPFAESDQMLRVVRFNVVDSSGSAVLVDVNNNNGTTINLATGTAVFNFDDASSGGAFTGGEFRPYVDRNDRTPFDPTDEQFTYVVQDFGASAIPGFSLTDPVAAMEEDYTATTGVNESVPRTMTITTTQVNDAPVFPELDTISFPEDVNPDGDPVFIDVYSNTLLASDDPTVHNLPLGIFVADPNTALDEIERQTLTFSYSSLATSAPAGMFTADPVLDEYGVLTLMPAPDAFGYAVFEVTATDDGVDTTGAADPRSSTRTLTVHITPVNDAPVTEDRQLTVDEVQEFFAVTGAPTNDVAVLPLNVSDFLTGPVADEDAEPSDFTDGVTVVDEFDEEDQSLRVVEFTVVDSDGNPLVVDASNHNGSIINLVTGTVVFNFDDPAAGGAFTGGEYRPYVDVNNRTPFDPTEEIAYFVEDFYQDPDNDVTIPGASLIDPAEVNDDDYTSSTGENRSASRTLTITTTQVNDIPEIILNSEIIEILERDDEVGTVIDDFASLVAPGRATALDELVRQGVSFSFARYESLSVAGLFHRDPEVTPEGELTVFPSIDAVGTGVVVVTATDANPSDASFVPRSVEVTFTVHVRPINDAPRLNDVNVPTSITSPNGDSDDLYEVLDNGTLVVTMREDNTADDGTTDEAYVLEARRGVGGDRPGLLDLFTPGPENEADGTLGGSQTLEITSFSPTTALGGTVAAVRDSNDRIIQLLYTPPTNSNRDIVQIDSLTYTVQDDGTDYDLPTANEIPVADPSARLEPAELSTTGRVRFILNPVNDRPEFSIRRPSVDVPEDSGPYSEGSFVANIFAGPRSGDPNTFATDELSSQLIDRFEVRPVSVASPEDPTNPTPLTPALYAAAFPGSGVVTVALNGELSFEAAANVYGIFEFDIVAVDNGADPSAGRGDLNESLPRRLTINIANVNDPPFLVGSDTLMTTTIEDAIGTDAITIPTTGPGSMLENFRAGPSAPAAGLPDENTSGALQLVNVPARSDRGGFVTPELSAGQIVGYRYEPAPNFAGTDTFTYSVTDGDPANLTSGTVMIDVTPVNDGPDIAIANNNLSVSEDPPSPVVISDWLTTALPGPAGDTGGVGRASDEIDGLNAIPAQTIDSYVFEFLSGDTGLLVTSDPVNDPGFRIIGNDLQFTVTPDANGTAVYQLVAIDDGPTTGDNVNVSDPITFVLSVGEVNDPPFFTPGPSPIIVEEDFVVPGGLDRAYDEPWATGISPGAEDERDTQTVQFNIDVAVEDQDKFDVLPAIDGVTGNLSFRLAPDAEGPVIVVVTPQDVIAGTPGIEGQPFDLRIEITPQDDAPRPTDDQFESDEDVTLRFTTADLLSNDVDPDTGDALVFVSLQTTTTLGATVTVNSEGEISYNPQTSDALQALIDVAQYDPDDPTQLLSDFQRIDTFTYQVTDTDGEVAIPEAVVTLTINGVNDAPTVHDKSIAIADSGLTTFNVFTGDDNDTDDFDVDGAINPASFVITREPQFGDLSDDNEDGTLTYLPGPDFAGEDFFEYTVADDLGQDSQAARFTLFGRPIPNGEVQGGTSVGRAGEIDVTDSFTSPFPLDLSTLTIVTQPENGTATVNDGLIVYTPDPGYTGDDFLVFRVADINGNFTDDIRMDLTTVSSRLQNPIDPSDVNRNGEVTALDALLVVNRLNAAGGIGQIPVTDDDFGIGTNNGVDEQFYYDQSGDGFISALDALRVINTINEQDLLPVSEPLFSASGSPLTTDEQLAGTSAASPAKEPNSVDELASKVVGTAGTSDATLAAIALDQVEQGAGQESDAEAANLDQAIQQLF